MQVWSINIGRKYRIRKTIEFKGKILVRHAILIVCGKVIASVEPREGDGMKVFRSSNAFIPKESQKLHVNFSKYYHTSTAPAKRKKKYINTNH